MHFEHENGKRVTTALFNGYPVGNGILEGVLFECEIVDDKVVVKGVQEEDKEYFNTLNTNYWLEKVTQCVQDQDLFQDKDGNDLYLCPPCESQTVAGLESGMTDPPSPTMQRFVFNLSNPDTPGGEAILFVAEKHKDFINHEIHMNCYGQLATIQTTDTLNSDTLFRLAQALQAWEQQN